MRSSYLFQRAFSEVHDFFSYHRRLRTIATALCFLFFVAVIISILEVFSIISVDPPLLRVFYAKCMNWGMDGSVLTILAIVKGAVLIVPLWIMRTTESSILGIAQDVRNGNPVWTHPLNLVFLIVMAIYVILFLMVVGDKKKRQKEEHKKVQSYNDFLSKCEKVSDLYYQGLRFSGLAYNGKPHKGQLINDKGYMMSVEWPYKNGKLSELYELGHVITYPFGVYSGEVTYIPAANFWYPHGFGWFTCSDTKVKAAGNWVYGNLPAGYLLFRKGYTERYQWEISMDSDAWKDGMEGINLRNVDLAEKQAMIKRRDRANVLIRGPQETVEDRCWSVMYSGELRNLVPHGLGSIDFNNYRQFEKYKGKPVENPYSNASRLNPYSKVYVTGHWFRGKLEEAEDYSYRVYTDNPYDFEKEDIYKISQSSEVTRKYGYIFDGNSIPKKNANSDSMWYAGSKENAVDMAKKLVEMNPLTEIVIEK